MARGSRSHLEAAKLISAFTNYASRTVQPGAERLRLKSILTFGAALVCALLVCWLITQAPARVGERPWADVWLRLAQVLFVAGLVALAALPLRQGWKYELVVALFSLFLTVVAFLPLKNTPFGLNGALHDQAYYTAAVTKFAAYRGNVDIIYKDLPSFYPPLYFYILGRLAAFSRVEPYLMIRYGLLMTTFLVPFVTWWLWRRLVDPAVALAVVFSALLFQDWYKNAEWLVLILFVPWWLYWVEDVRDRRPPGWRAQLRWFVAGGLIGTIIFQTYYYWFFQGGVSLVLNVSGSRWFVRDNPWTLQRVRAAVVMLASVALFSVVYWGPYLTSMAATGGWTPMQARWLRQGLVRLPLPIADGSLHGWLFAVGLAYLLWSARRDRVARGLLGLLLGVYGWLILGYVGILADRPLLTFKAYPVVEYLLAIATSLAFGQMWRQRLYPGWLKPYEVSAHRFLSVALVVLLLFLSQHLVIDYVDESSIQLARDMEYPRDRLVAFDAMTERQYAGKVVLASTDDLVVFRPVYMFQPLNVLFSHPAGLFERRSNFLEELALTSDPRLFAAAWMNNRYSPIDYVMLDWDGAAWRAEYWEDNFPNKTRPVSIAFSPAAFAPAYFQGETVDGYTLFSTRFASDPLPAIVRDSLPSASPETLVLLYALATSFHEHVVLPNAEASRLDLEQRLARIDLAALPVASLLDLQLAAHGALQNSAQATLLARLPNKLDVTLVDENGRPKLQLLGSEIQPSATGNAGAQLAIYFKVVDRFPIPEPGEPEYRIWVRATGPGEHQGEERSLVRPARWEPGKIYRHVHPLPLAPGDYQLAVGFRRGEAGPSLALPTAGWQVELGSHLVP